MKNKDVIKATLLAEYMAVRVLVENSDCSGVGCYECPWRLKDGGCGQLRVLGKLSDMQGDSTYEHEED